MTAKKAVLYEELKQRSLQDPNVKPAYDTLEPAYQNARLRIEQGLSQAAPEQRLEIRFVASEKDRQGR